ncbi:MAG: hypothetical protein AAF555_02745 [Verrucomicrobiota bacterium]
MRGFFSFFVSVLLIAVTGLAAFYFFDTNKNLRYERSDRPDIIVLERENPANEP